MYIYKYIHCTTHIIFFKHLYDNNILLYGYNNYVQTNWRAHKISFFFLLYEVLVTKYGI